MGRGTADGEYGSSRSCQGPGVFRGAMSEDANAMLPIIRQIHDAESDEARAGVLLQLPDVVLV